MACVLVPPSLQVSCLRGRPLSVPKSCLVCGCRLRCRPSQLSSQILPGVRVPPALQAPQILPGVRVPPALQASRLRCRPSPAWCAGAACVAGPLSSAQLLVVVVIPAWCAGAACVAGPFSSAPNSCLVCGCRLRCRPPNPAWCAGAACVAGQPLALQAPSHKIPL